jgi:hypothetical protein
MATENKDELDLLKIIQVFKNIFKKWLLLFFNALDFIFRNWKTVLGLIAIGLVLGYFTQNNNKPLQKATVLLRVNFDAVNYLYSEVELFNEKIKEKDSLFFTKIGFNINSLEVKDMELTPLINLKDIVDKYEQTYRNLDGLLQNLDFEDNEINVSETFTTEYKYHNLEFSLLSNANEETIAKIINFFNNDELLRKVRNVGIKNMEDRIISNEKVISQIDTVIKLYSKNESLSSPSDQTFVVDKNFNIHGILNKKTELLLDNEKIREELVVSDNIIVMMNEPRLLNEKPGILGNKFIFYPFVFVLGFLLLAFARHSYLYLKEVAYSVESE